uniref:Uncharacterized protein n=1 Tax=Lactuca sativa TaxID=4236 RepID=A0A9R1W5L2_LACSA|nr:hypothetical protein LSAT_V11C300110210 [Lactuca sativa]
MFSAEAISYSNHVIVALLVAIERIRILLFQVTVPVSDFVLHLLISSIFFFYYVGNDHKLDLINRIAVKCYPKNMFQGPTSNTRGLYTEDIDTPTTMIVYVNHADFVVLSFGFGVYSGTFDGNSIKVAELLFNNGFKEAYVI